MRNGTLGLVVVVCSAVALAGQAAVPVHQEPLHKPVFENKAVRIIDLSLQPGQASADHIHANDTASVSISSSDSQVRVPGSDWGATRAIRPVGEVQLTEYAGKPGTHAVRNNGKTLYRVIGVHNLKLSGWTTTPPLASSGPVKALSSIRSFHTYDVRLAAKQAVDRTHQQPTVVMLVTGSATLTRAAAAPTKLDASQRWAVLNAGEAFKLTADADAHLVEMEAR